jgi:hypothetical protein
MAMAMVIGSRVIVLGVYFLVRFGLDLRSAISISFRVWLKALSDVRH